MVATSDIDKALSELLKPSLFRDYCVNGIQVSGKENIQTLVTGVTASLALIEQAIDADADAILVHHGLFWMGDDLCITGMKHKRVRALLMNDINLFAYHLPLDAHPALGNNAQLADQLEFHSLAPCTMEHDPSYVFRAKLEPPKSANALKAHITLLLGREPLLIEGGCDKPIESIALCTGGAQKYIDLAVQEGVDAYITGEASEQTVHIAREMGIHFFAAGHHATERYGVQAVGDYLAEKFGITHTFIDIDNPV